MRTILSGLLLASLAIPSLAEAQPWTGERWIRWAPHRIEADGSLYVRDEQLAFSPSLRGRFRLIDNEHPIAREALILDLDVAFRSVGIAGPADSFRIGNPYAGLRLGYRTPLWTARGGVGTTAPVTNAFDDGPQDVIAYRLGQAVHGVYDGWLMEPRIQPLVLRGDFEMHVDYVQFGADAAFAVIFPFERYPGADTELAFQTGGFVAVVPIPEIAFGFRLSLFFATDWTVGFANVDEAQLSLLPFFRLDLEGFFLELRLMINLDEPYGFAFDDGVWAFSLGIGGRF